MSLVKSGIRTAELCSARCESLLWTPSAGECCSKSKSAHVTAQLTASQGSSGAYNKRCELLADHISPSLTLQLLPSVFPPFRWKAIGDAQTVLFPARGFEHDFPQYVSTLPYLYCFSAYVKWARVCRLLHGKGDPFPSCAIFASMCASKLGSDVTTPLSARQALLALSFLCISYALPSLHHLLGVTWFLKNFFNPHPSLGY